MTPNVAISDIGMVRLGISVVRGSRRKAKITSTTRTTVISIVICTPSTDAWMVWVRSPTR